MSFLQPAAKASERLNQPGEHYQSHLAQACELLQQARKDHVHIKQASSLGAEDVVVSHLIASLGLDIPVFVLDTGALHHQTYALLERQQASKRLNIEVYKPQHAQVIQWVAANGQDSIYKNIESRKSCCDLRKMEPLSRALANQTAWITGLRREQSNARAEVPLVDSSEQASKGRLKYNPLVNWSWGDVWHYIAINQVDYNPLHDEFFPSIGCAPCTRAISMGEDFRAGRWWWEDEAAKECGLHVSK